MKTFLRWCWKHPMKSLPFFAMFAGLAVAIGFTDPISLPLVGAYLALLGVFMVIMCKDWKGTL